jgi:IclR family acetate operon transcriptional repressor
MRRLRDKVKETVCLIILVDGQGFVLESVPGVYPFRCVVDPGMRQPLHASGSCKAILTYLPEDQRTELIRSIRLVCLTESTICQKASLRKEIDRIRENGYAVDDCEHIDGVRCVSAPIFDRQATPVASLTVTGPMGRMPKESLPTLRRLVREYADVVSASLVRLLHFSAVEIALPT